MGTVSEEPESSDAAAGTFALNGITLSKAQRIRCLFECKSNKEWVVDKKLRYASSFPKRELCLQPITSNVQSSGRMTRYRRQSLQKSRISHAPLSG